MSGWQVIERDGVNHVVPAVDIKPHSIDEACWCKPTDDEGVIVHHSMDRREDYENGRKPQ